MGSLLSVFSMLRGAASPLTAKTESADEEQRQRGEAPTSDRGSTTRKAEGFAHTAQKMT